MRKELSKLPLEAVCSAVFSPCAGNFWWEIGPARPWGKNQTCLIFFASRGQFLIVCGHRENRVELGQWTMSCTVLLLHYKSHVDDLYKCGLLKTMLDRAFRLSSSWHYFSGWRIWSTEIIVFSTKISWQTCQLFHYTVCCRQSIGSTCYHTYCQRSIRPNSCCPTV